MARRRRNLSQRRFKRRAAKKLFKAACARCGKEMLLEVSPPPGKPLLCFDCYKSEESE
jgi:CxxC-x17-CxxC domain-containing protein